MTEIDFPEGLTEEEKEQLRSSFNNDLANKINNQIDQKSIPLAHA